MAVSAAGRGSGEFADMKGFKYFWHYKVYLCGPDCKDRNMAYEFLHPLHGLVGGDTFKYVYGEFKKIGNEFPSEMLRWHIEKQLERLVERHEEIMQRRNMHDLGELIAKQAGPKIHPDPQPYEPMKIYRISVNIPGHDDGGFYRWFETEEDAVAYMRSCRGVTSYHVVTDIVPTTSARDLIEWLNETCGDE